MYTNPNSDSNTYQGTLVKKSGAENVFYGLIFCSTESLTPESHYLFGIDVNQNYEIRRIYSYSITLGGGRSLGDYVLAKGYSPNLKPGYDVPNEIVISKRGEEFTAYINGVRETSFTDGEYGKKWDDSPAGEKIGFYSSIGKKEVEKFPDMPVDVRFSFSTRESPLEAPAVPSGTVPAPAVPPPARAPVPAKAPPAAGTRRAAGIQGALKTSVNNIIPNLPRNSKIAVLNISSGDPELVEFVIGELENDLVNAGDFTIVDRSSLD
ncbi:MAG: hypothetical protein LBS06_01860, partial [Treponema sp.]|nr:hypothetical protein [Treponema sp.]